MEWLWFVSATSAVLSLVALGVARGLARRLARLSEQYWELKYEHGELKARLKALAPTPEEQVAAQPAVRQTFVPLTGLKKPGLISPEGDARSNPSLDAFTPSKRQ